MFRLTKEWLNKKYNEYNFKYFRNLLPNKINFYLTCKQKKIMGQVIVNEKNNSILGICFNSFLIVNEEQARSILLHELIHVLLHIKYNYGGHDERFMKIAKILNSKENLKNYPITTKEYISRLNKTHNRIILNKKYYIYIYEKYFIIKDKFIKDINAKNIYVTINPLIKLFDINKMYNNSSLIKTIISDKKTKKLV